MCVYFRGIGVGRCPFFSRLNSVPAFNRSDRMCVRLPIVPAGRYPFPEPLNTLSEEVPMKAVYCPYCGGQLGAANGYSPFMAIRMASAIE